MSAREQRELGGHAMGLFVAVSFGSTYAISKPVLAVVDPVTFAGARYLLAACGLFVLLCVQSDGWRISRHEVPRLVVLGLLGYTAFQAGWGVALSMTTASKAVVLVATTPVFSAVFARIGGDRLAPLGWLGVGIAFAGVFLVINNSLSEITIGGGSVYGDALFIVIAAIWALYGALSRPVVLRLGTLRTTTWAAIFGCAGLLPLSIPGLLHSDWQAVTVSHVLAFLYASLVVGVFGLMAWGSGLARLGLARISAYLYLSPVFGVTLSGLLLEQWLSKVQLLGAATVLAGVAMTQLLGRARPHTR